MSNTFSLILGTGGQGEGLYSHVQGLYSQGVGGRHPLAFGQGVRSPPSTFQGCGRPRSESDEASACRDRPTSDRQGGASGSC